MDPLAGLTLNLRNHCPSCHYRITPLVLECPQCGLSLARQPLPRPLLFQASALKTLGPAKGEPQSLATPALGRVEPMTILERVPEDDAAPGSGRPTGDLASPAPALALEPPARAADLDVTDSFWPVVKMEALECLVLLALNALLMGIASWMAGAPPAAVYPAFWPYLLPVHFSVSWAYLMVPLVLVGQSPMMGHEGLLLDTELPERRMSFAVLHLVSALAFPVSFLCMVLTPGHRTLAELLSGLEILQLPERRMR
jgi:hypothetical protein